MTTERVPSLRKRWIEAGIAISVMTALIGFAIGEELWTGARGIPYLFVWGPILWGAFTVFWLLAAGFPYDDATGRSRVVTVALMAREIALWTGLLISGTYLAGLLFLLAKWALTEISDAPKGQGAVGVAVMGSLFFWFRLKRRSCYGALEAILGVIIGAVTYTKNFEHGITDLKAHWTSVDLTLGVLTAGVYLVVRGLDNVHQGVVKDPKDPWAVALCQRAKGVFPFLDRGATNKVGEAV